MAAQFAQPEMQFGAPAPAGGPEPGVFFLFGLWSSKVFCHPLRTFLAVSENNNLIVNYIPNNLTEVDLRNLFTPYGEISHCKLVLDKITGTPNPCSGFTSSHVIHDGCSLNITGASAGYGFVKYTADEGAHKALSALNGFQLNGKTLKVSIARPMHQKNEKTTLYVAGASQRVCHMVRIGLLFCLK
jgi:hypothetical protein